MKEKSTVPLSIKEMEFVIEIIPSWNISSLEAFICEFYQANT